MDDAKVAEIARGLTKAQRRMVVNARHREADGAHWPQGWYVSGDMRMRRGLSRNNLILDYLPALSRLLPLGLAVRSHILQEKERG
ncbi:MAG: hypothetical protein CMN74_12260 [Sphingorhabdus sp.]|nr:hypothetical protein [Sphingorhabdus sp.]|tara:strand:+ start:883 stop:1137 length:255 start_codon:yes stop_codon:yes gene_type:complete